MFAPTFAELMAQGLIRKDKCIVSKDSLELLFKELEHLKIAKEGLLSRLEESFKEVEAKNAELEKLKRTVARLRSEVADYCLERDVQYVHFEKVYG